MAPVVYMLCGLVGSGKTTYASGLEGERFSIDERVFERHGQHGVDYPEDRYPAHQAEALEELDRRLLELLAAGKSVVLDYGFWTRAWRDRYKELIERAGSTWRLLYFEVDPEVLRRRLAERNERGGANAMPVTNEMFGEFLRRFEPPSGEGEERPTLPA